jgi:type IV pilus assembly protein PilN
MIRINLLPIRISKRQEAVRQEVLFSGFGLAIILGVGIFFSVQVGADIDAVKADNATMSQEIEVLNQTVRRVEEVDQLRAELQLKLDIISELKATKSGPVHMLAELSLATPEKLTLTELHEEDYQISLEGYALSPEVISDFMTNLDTSIWFKDVYLIEMEGEVQDGRRLNTFTIQATFVLPGESDEPAGEEEAG